MQEVVFNNLYVEPKTFVTGDIPTQAFGIMGGRGDWSDSKSRILWSGCIDAPDYIPTGKMVVSTVEQAIVPGSVARF